MKSKGVICGKKMRMCFHSRKWHSTLFHSFRNSNPKLFIH